MLRANDSLVASAIGYDSRVTRRDSPPLSIGCQDKHRNKFPTKLILLSLLAVGCGTPEKASPPTPTKSSTDWFSEQAQATGLDFVHVNGMSGERFIAEIMGPGVALFDYDNDGDLDLLEVAGGKQRLLRNDTGKFVDVTAQSGALAKAVTGSAGAAVAGDYDNDGKPDLLIVRSSGMMLYHHDGKG